MLDRNGIFGDFSDEAFSRGMCKLITQKTLSLLQYHKTRHEDFQKILNPYANQKILDDIKIKVFDDFIGIKNLPIDSKLWYLHHRLNEEYAFLSNELDLFKNLQVVLLMGDFAIKSINYIKIILRRNRIFIN